MNGNQRRPLAALACDSGPMASGASLLTPPFVAGTHYSALPAAPDRFTYATIEYPPSITTVCPVT